MTVQDFLLGKLVYMGVRKMRGDTNPDGSCLFTFTVDWGEIKAPVEKELWDNHRQDAVDAIVSMLEELLLRSET